MPYAPRPMMVRIGIIDVPCPVIERQGYNHDVGGYAAIVMVDGREQLAVKQTGIWRLWGASDRVQPLVEAIERNLRAGRGPFEHERVDASLE